MLNFKRKRVLNPNLIVKAILLSVFVGAFTMVASLPVDAAQISLEEELAILTGRDNHSKYLPNDSEEEEEDCYEPSERSMMLEHPPTKEDNCDQARLSISESTAEVDIPINDEEYKIYNAYMDGMSAGEEHKRFMDRFEDKGAPKTKKEYKQQIELISFWASPALKIRTYEKNHSEEETEAYSAALKNSAQEYMFEQIEEKRQQAWHLNTNSTPLVLQSVPDKYRIPKFDIDLSSEQNNRQSNEQSNKHQNKHGDLCPCLLI